MTKKCDSFARAFGAYQLADLHAGSVIEREAELDRRVDETAEALIRAQATNAAGVLSRLEMVWDHVRDHDEGCGRLRGELEACQRELMERGADFAHVADALTVLARRFEREELPTIYLRFLRASARDARALAVRVATA